MPLQCMKVEVSNYIATVVMDRPPVNAQNAQFRAEIMEVFDSFNDRDEVRVAVLTGAGKVFCAGADIKERGSIIKAPGDYARHNRTAREYANCIRECAIPVGAAMLTHLVGKSRGRRIIFTGDRIPAPEMYRLGVIEWCGPRESLMDEATK